MEYLVLRKQKNSTDEEVDEFKTFEQAEKFADEEYNHLCDKDIKNNEYFIILKSVNPDEESEEHLDGDIVKTYKAIDNTPSYKKPMSFSADITHW